MDLTGRAAQALARRSSRRQFIKLIGASSLGTGLFLTRTGVSIGSVDGGGCVGCGGGPCNDCFSPAPLCEDLQMPYACKTCVEGGGCPEGCSTSGEWFCCLNHGPRVNCRFRCSECNCPSGCNNPNCHCFTNLAIPCTPRLHSGDQPCACPPVEQRSLVAANG
jgi:hypothetical protein